MTEVRNAQCLHHVEYMDASELAAELRISEEDAIRHIGYSRHFYGIDDLTEYYDDVDAYDYLFAYKSTAPPKQIIYHRIPMEYFRNCSMFCPEGTKTSSASAMVFSAIRKNRLRPSPCITL